MQINLPFFFKDAHVNKAAPKCFTIREVDFFELCLEVCGFHVWINQVQLFQKDRAWMQSVVLNYCAVEQHRELILDAEILIQNTYYTCKNSLFDNILDLLALILITSRLDQHLII